MNPGSTIRTLVMLLSALLLGGCASAIHDIADPGSRGRELTNASIHAENVEMAQAGDLDAMHRIIEGRYQIRLGAMGRRDYVPYQVTGIEKRDERKFFWPLPPQDVMNWVQRAADGGSDPYQRVLVLCHQFGCVPCDAKRGTPRFNNPQCDRDHPLVPVDPARARMLAVGFQQRSAQPASWDGMIRLLDDLAESERSARAGNAQAAWRVAELCRDAARLGAADPYDRVALLTHGDYPTRLLDHTTHME